VSFTIRSATLDDLEQLARLHRTSFDAPWTEPSFHETLDRPGVLALVGKDAAATDLQSFIVIQLAADESEILTIATDPAARRTGLARALIVQAAAREQRQATQMRCFWKLLKTIPARWRCIAVAGSRRMGAGAPIIYAAGNRPWMRFCCG